MSDLDKITKIVDSIQPMHKAILRSEISQMRRSISYLRLFSILIKYDDFQSLLINLDSNVQIMLNILKNIEDLKRSSGCLYRARAADDINKSIYYAFNTNNDKNYKIKSIINTYLDYYKEQNYDLTPDNSKYLLIKLLSLSKDYKHICTHISYKLR